MRIQNFGKKCVFRHVVHCAINLVLLFGYVTAQLREGDVCIIGGVERGVCTKKNLCRAVGEISVPPIFCSNQDNIICCREVYVGADGRRTRRRQENPRHENEFSEPETSHQLENIFDLENKYHDTGSHAVETGRKKHSISSIEPEENFHSGRRENTRGGNRVGHHQNGSPSSEEKENYHRQGDGVHGPKEGNTFGGNSGRNLEHEKERGERLVWNLNIGLDNAYGTTSKPKPLYQQHHEYESYYDDRATTRRYYEHIESSKDSWQKPKPLYPSSWDDYRPTTPRQTKPPIHQYYQTTRLPFDSRPNSAEDRRTTENYYQPNYESRPKPTKTPSYQYHTTKSPYESGEDRRTTEDYYRPGYGNTPKTTRAPQYNPYEEFTQRPRPTERPKPDNSYNRPNNEYRPPHNHNSNEYYEHGSRPNPTQGAIFFPEPTEHHNPPGHLSSGESHRPQTPSQPNRRPYEKKRISEIKCKEYSQVVVETIAGLPLTADAQPIEIQVQKCSLNAQQLIVGGENSTVGEFPHMAAVGFVNKQSRQVEWLCGGSLISEHFILTAAHCRDNKNGNPTVVRLGELNLKTVDDGAHPVDFYVKEMIRHPEYRPPARYNDIALLRLSRPVTITREIRPACLYTKNTFQVSKTVATGWGRTLYGADTSDILLKVVLNIIDNHKCNTLYKAESRTQLLSKGITETQMCAGELNGEKDTCQGDSGGPIEITTKSNQCLHHVIGVTSFGKRCGLPNAPGVYTRVSAYIPWIESIVWPEETHQQQR